MLRRPDIRKIHVFYERDDDLCSVPSMVFRIASDSMRYSGITIQGYSLSSLDIAKNLETTKKFARDRRAARTTAATVKEAILVDDSKHT